MEARTDTSGGKRIFSNISHLSWEHPADKMALNALRNIPVLDEAVKMIMRFLPEKILKLEYLSSAVRVNERQIPRIYGILKECCEILDSPYVPEIYIVQNPDMNAMAMGADKPFLVFNSGLIKNMDNEKLSYVMGHELGHILSGHVLYKQVYYLVQFLLNRSADFLPPPIANVIRVISTTTMILTALIEWNKKSELSADRAGLLCTQDPNMVYNSLMQMAGGSFSNEMSVEEFIKQSEEYENNVDFLESVYKRMIAFEKSHPFLAVRVKELKKWVEKGEYDAILNGDYKKREEGKKEDYHNTAFKDFQDTYESYKQDIHESNDPINKIISSINDNASEITKKAEEFVRNIFNNIDKNNK